MQHSPSEDQISRSAAAARTAMAGSAGIAIDHRPSTTGSNSLLESYLKRVNPQVAASFTPAQRDAIKSILGLRGLRRHALDFRRSFGLGRKRYYVVLLMGRENRSLGRLEAQGLNSGVMSLLAYLFLSLLLLLPIFAVVYLLKMFAEIDVMAGGFEIGLQALAHALA